MTQFSAALVGIAFCTRCARSAWFNMKLGKKKMADELYGYASWAREKEKQRKVDRKEGK